MAGNSSYIYLDSKIIGAAKQIVVFFEDSIFLRENTVILIKKYKHKSAKQLAAIFEQSKIAYRFVSMADLDSLEGGIIFYPFNAQSNVRAVANRKLKHVFITHGESNKVASVKPIIRIYDYVITAGQAGIDRFLSHGIFTLDDVKNGRIIQMGNTFIGKTGLSRTSKGEPCLFYAPTWEGGIEQENYSSLSNIELVITTLKGLAIQYQTTQIVIRPHPNTGHRLKHYLRLLIELIKRLSSSGLKIAIFSKNLSVTWITKWKLKRKGVQLIDDLTPFYAKFGLCDISAMETQLVNEDIPYFLFWDKKKYPNIFMDSSVYESSQFSKDYQHFIRLVEQDRHHQFKHYLINSNRSILPLSERIPFLFKLLHS